MPEPANLSAAAETVLTFLESVGRRSEAEFYLGLFRKLPKQSFALIVVGSSAVRQTLGSIAEQLRFLSELGLYAPVILGLFDVARPTAGADRLAQRLASLGLLPTRHALSAPDLAERLSDELRGEKVPILSFDAQAPASVSERLAAVGELGRRLDSRKLVVLRRGGGIRPERRPPGLPLVELGPGHRVPLRHGAISNVNLRTDYEPLIARRLLRKDDGELLNQIATLLDQEAPRPLLVSVTSPLYLLEELFTVKGAGTLIKPGTAIDLHPSYAKLDVARLRKLLASSFDRRLKEAFFERPPLAIYLEQDYRGAAILHASEQGAYLSKFAVDPEAQGEGIGQDLWQAMCREHDSLFWRARPDNPIAGWYAGLADGLARLADWHVYWRGVSTRAIPAVIEEALGRPVDFEA
ncbi:MAG TPA: GNAT family N-acetyltransferase [Polyangiaceae bacterium]|jgi:acetylglutamate kinase